MRKVTEFVLHLLVLALIVMSVPTPASASDWEWTLTPYLMFPNVTVETKINELVDVELVDTQLSNVIDDTDFLFMGRFEGRKARNGFFLDVRLGDFGDEPRFHDLPGGNGSLEAKSDLQITVIEAGGLFNISGDGTGWSLFYGARMIDLDQEIDLFLPPALGGTRRIVNASETGFDALLGVRYDKTFESGFAFSFGGDVAAGTSEFTWSAQANLGYYFGAQDQFGLIVGYRYMDLQLDEADEVVDLETDIEVKGFQTGFTFKF